MIKFPHPGALRLVLIAFLMTIAYALCLRFALPGYLAPLAPFHGDFYDYTGMAAIPWAQVLRYPRPVTFSLFKIFGAGDVRGSMAAGIGVALADVFLVLLYAERIHPIRRRLPWVGTALFCVLLFTHPQFYIEHRHDMPAMFSLLFAMLALHCWLSWLKRSSIVALLLCPLCLAAFAFSKEAYFLSIFALGAPLLWLYGKRFQTFGFLVFCAVAEALSFLYSRSLAGPFVDPTAAATSTYYVDAHPGSILHVLTLYGYALISWPMLALIAIGLAQAFWRKQSQLVLAAFLTAGAGALLPIALLPNHVFAEYAWLAVPFVFIPVAFLEFPRGVSRPLQAIAAVAVLASFFLFEAHSRKVFRTAEIQWYVAQERIGRNLLASFSQIPPGIGGSRHVTVAGLDTPFLPWASDSYTAWRFGTERLWSVIVPKNEANWKDSRSVQFVTAPEADLARPGAILVYNEDGALQRILPEHSLRSAVELVPELAQPPIRPVSEMATAGELTAAGARYAHWSLFAEALPYFARAADSHEPEALFLFGRTEWLSGNHADGLKNINAAIARAASKDTAKAYRAELVGLQTSVAVARVLPSVELVPGTAVSPDASGLAIVTVKWRAPAGLPVEIRVGEAGGQLLASASGSGSTQTGKWVRDQTRFYLQDVSGGKSLSPENTLAQATAHVR